MTRPPLSLSHHLLTRSDLAKLGIQAGRILTWLANGWLDQVGNLPGIDAHGDPVFAVLTRDLRNELATRLQELGKDTVVFSPLRVRSLLVRAMLRNGKDPAAGPTATLGQPVEAAPPTPDPVAEALHDTNVTGVLRLAAQDLEQEVEQVLALAREEARLEALELATTSDPQPGPRSPSDLGEDSVDSPDDDDPISEDEGEADFFDTDDLAEELGAWAPDAAVDVPPVTEPLAVIATEPTPAAAAIVPANPPGSTEALPTETAAAESLTPTEVLAEQPTAAGPDAGADGGKAPDEAAITDEPEMRESKIMSEPKLDEVPEADATANPAVAHNPSRSNEAPAHEPTLEEMLSADQPVPEPASELALAPDDALFVELAAAPPAPAATSTEAPLAAQPPPDRASASEPANPAAETTSALAMQRVESFLGELRHVLVELANRPQPPALDVQPLVAAVQQGFVHSSQQAKATDTALASLTDRLGEFGGKVEHGVALAVHAALGTHRGGAVAAGAMPVATPSFVIARPERSTIALFAIGFLLLCWTAIFWFKTGNTKLALTTLVATNVIGCCLFVGKNRGA